MRPLVLGQRDVVPMTSGQLHNQGGCIEGIEGDAGGSCLKKYSVFGNCEIDIAYRLTADRRNTHERLKFNETGPPCRFITTLLTFVTGR